MGLWMDLAVDVVPIWYPVSMLGWYKQKMLVWLLEKKKKNQFDLIL